MANLAASDIDWRRGRVPLYVFYATDDVYEVGRNAFLKFFSENALGGKRAFFSLKRMEEEIVDMALDLFRAPPAARGNMTSGGSESIFLAIRACRTFFRKHHPRIRQPNMVVPYSAHPAFNKAGDVLDIEVRRADLAADLRADPSAIEKLIDPNTILLAGSAPCFPHGVIDPIAEIGRLAEGRGLWLHVDACVGGYFAPFARKLGRPIPDFDFSVPGVRSISADLHKFGFCPKPASTVFYRGAEEHECEIFDFENWPNGRFSTPTLTGTRPGGAVAAAWAVFNHLGETGYLAIADRLLKLTKRYTDGIRAIPGLKLWGEPDLSIINFGSEEFDIFAVAEVLKQDDWLIGLTQQPRGMHAMLSLIHEPVCDEYLARLRNAVELVRRQGGKPQSDLRATY